jgi:hypothetical protein
MPEKRPDATEPESGTQYFRTPYVFVDTEAYRRKNFDWEGEAPSGLLKLAKRRDLVLLTTYITKANAVEVPLAVDVQNLVDDHFANSAPFSDKKSSEFKDAMVCASLAAWCTKLNREAYVVSADPDLKAYCATTPNLIHVERVADVLSRALASEQLHTALREAFAESDHVAQALVDVVTDAPARTPGPSRHFAPGPIEADGYVTSTVIDDI